MSQFVKISAKGDFGGNNFPRLSMIKSMRDIFII